MTTSLPRVSVAFLSWNRLHYLRATVESARVCIDYPNLEWLLSDNDSMEPGLADYLDGLSWFDQILLRKQDHAAAMNELLAAATGKYIFIWPDDVQFVVKGKWLQEIVEVLENHQDVGSVCLDYMRASTLRDIFAPDLIRNRRSLLAELISRRGRMRHHAGYDSPGGFKLFTMGWRRPGIVGSGIPSLTATNIWRRLGPWRSTRERADIGLVDSSLGAESDMLQRAESMLGELQRAAPLIPVAADIVTDPAGCKAKVRGGYRYGVYMPPPEGTYYYRITPLEEVRFPDTGLPMDFTEGVHPIGFRIPFDRHGERKKSSINTSVVFDIAKNEYIEFPLRRADLALD